MDQHIDIEDVVLPLRTYAWAVTGSVVLADQLLAKCFEEVARATSDTFPTTKIEWFDYIDDVVVDWVSSGHESTLSEHGTMTETIKMIENVQQDVLCNLLDRSGEP